MVNFSATVMAAALLHHGGEDDVHEGWRGQLASRPPKFLQKIKTVQGPSPRDLSGRQRLILLDFLLGEVTDALLEVRFFIRNASHMKRAKIGTRSRI